MLGNDNITTTALKGNVGIGTTSPDSKLHIATSGQSQAAKLYQAQYQQFQFNYPDTYQSSLDFGHFGKLMYEGNGGYLILRNRSGQVGSHIRFETSNTERLRITHDGNVGIGTTNPSAKFHLYDNNSTSGGSYASPHYIQLNRSSTGGSPSATYFTKEDYTLGGTDLFGNSLGKQIYATITNTGTSNYRNLMSRVHTTSTGGANNIALYATHFEGLGTGTINNLYGMVVGYTAGITGFSNPNSTITNTYGLYLGSLTSGTQTNAPYAIYQEGTEKIFLQGNVGIGTTNPAYKLHTEGTFGLQAAGTGTNENFKILNGSAGTIMQALDNGNVGIGGNAQTSGSYKLRVHGGIWANSFEQLQTLNGSSGVGRIQYYNTGGSHRTLGLRTYGPHAAESVKGFIEISSQALTYSGIGNIVLHADTDFVDHPTLVLRSLNTAADSFYMQNYHHNLGALFITKATAGGDDSMRFRPGRTSDVLVVSTTGIEVNGGIVAGSSTLSASAVLEANSTTKGFLPPRMTGAQAEAISSPAEGLMVYSTDGSGVTITSKGWWGYDGATWIKL